MTSDTFSIINNKTIVGHRQTFHQRRGTRQEYTLLRPAFHTPVGLCTNLFEARRLDKKRNSTSERITQIGGYSAIFYTIS